MGNLLPILKKYLWFVLIGSFLIFIWGLAAWIAGRHYQPEIPVQIPARHYLPAKKENVVPLSRYQSLFDGSLFFGEPVVRKSAFQSRLILWGLINGSLAVVGVDPGSSQNTWIVKAGDTVEDEKIVAVGVRSITVRNRTGEGKVTLSE